MLELIEITTGNYNGAGKLTDLIKVHININNIDQVEAYDYVDAYGSKSIHYMIETKSHRYPVTKETYNHIINTYSVKLNAQN